VVPNIGHVPNRDILINQGNQTFVTSGTTAVQPLTPLIRIHQANRIAASTIAVSRDELKKTENEVALKVHEVYYGILIARLQKQAAEQDRTYSRVRLFRRPHGPEYSGNGIGLAICKQNGIEYPYIRTASAANANGSLETALSKAPRPVAYRRHWPDVRRGASDKGLSFISPYPLCHASR
jgi:hypothetical protein